MKVSVESIYTIVLDHSEISSVIIGLEKLMGNMTATNMDKNQINKIKSMIDTLLNIR